MDTSSAKPAHLETQTIVSYPPSFYFRYFGWPTVARLEDGTLALAASGFRHGHMCPWGKSVLWESHDEGKTWEEPDIINDSSIDDRDTGLIALPGGRLLLTWFSSDMRYHYRPVDLAERQPLEDRRREKSGDPAQWRQMKDGNWMFRATTDAWQDENVARDLGSFVRIPIAYFMSRIPGATLFHVGLGTPAASLVSLVLCIIYFRMHYAGDKIKEMQVIG